MNMGYDPIRFVFPELTEPEKAVSNRHFWTCLVSDSSLVFYRADSGWEVLGLAPGIFISSAVRSSRAKKLVGVPLAQAIPAGRRTFKFDRASGRIQLRTAERGILGKSTFLVLTDENGQVEIALPAKLATDLKNACKECEFMPA